MRWLKRNKKKIINTSILIQNLALNFPHFIPKDSPALPLLLSPSELAVYFHLVRGAEFCYFLDSVPKTQQEISYYKTRISNSQDDVELHHLTAHLEIAERKLKRYSSSKECCICRDEFTNPVFPPCCFNLFCRGCLEEWLRSNTSCPMCRGCVNLCKLTTLDLR